MKKYGKFAALIAVILGTLVWLGTNGSGEAQSYYKTIAEVRQMGAEVAFTLVGENQTLRVVYTGTEPLPDTFRDGSQALAEGKMDADGTFHSTKVQAKCASKYAPKPGELYKPAEANQKISSNKQGM